jgi:hypothetical protein
LINVSLPRKRSWILCEEKSPDEDLPEDFSHQTAADEEDETGCFVCCCYLPLLHL